MIVPGQASTQPCIRWRSEVVWNSSVVAKNGIRKASLKVFLSSTKSQTSLHLITAMIVPRQASTQACFRWRPEAVWNSAAVTVNGLRKTSLKVFLSSTKSQTSLHLITAMIVPGQASTQPCIRWRPEVVWNSAAVATYGLGKASLKVFLSSTKSQTSLHLITYCNDWLKTGLNPTKWVKN